MVGHAKSGTTALYIALRRHPEIFMPLRVKEPWYFASELRLHDTPRPRLHGVTPKTLEQYLSLFEPARADQRAGEASALYLWSRTAAAGIAEVQPAARIIAVLREPVSFLRSLHMQMVQVYLEPEKNLRKAIALEPERRAGRHVPPDTYWPGATLYSDFVRYVEQLKRYAAVFPAEQVLTLIYDDFRRDNPGVVRQVLRFLEVDDTVPVAVREANPSVHVRSRRLHQLAHSLSSGEGTAARVAQGLVGRVAGKAISRSTALAVRNRLLFARPEPEDRELTTELKQRFKPEVEALSEYLGRDLVSLWGYDELG